MGFLLLTKFCFSLLLLGIFLMFFGLPAYRKYEAKEIFVDFKTIGIEKVKNPALTFCPLNTWTGLG